MKIYEQIVVRSKKKKNENRPLTTTLSAFAYYT